jgi:hypothetical protein
MLVFDLGQTVMTRGVANLFNEDKVFRKFVNESFMKYCNADWGETCEEDKELNDQALKIGDRILAVYKKEGLETIWIITEWDRSATTILFPSEY